MTKERAQTISRFGLLLAIVSALLAAVSGVGTRYALWDFRTGLKVFRWAAYFGAAAFVLSLLGVILSLFGRVSRSFLVALAGTLISAVIVVVPLHMLQKARSLPVIHDITTDTENPPSFVAVLPLRKNALNSSEYGGEPVATQQQKAYPDIVPLSLNIQPGPAFDKAVEVAQRLGWKMVAADRKDGRIEATDTTFWFGFRDDIVIRISGSEEGSCVDVRSVSRVGKSDIGTNANRIRKFLKEMSNP